MASTHRRAAAITRIGLVFVGGSHGFVELLFLLLVHFFCLRASSCFSLISTSVPAAASPLITAYRAVGHAKIKRGVVGLATHRVMSLLRSCRHK